MRKLVLWAVAAVALYAVAGFLVAPPIARSQLERVLGEQLGRRVTIERVRINPFALSVSVHNFDLKEPDGSTTAIGFEALNVDAALSSLFSLGPVVESVHLVKPYVHVVRNADGTYSFQDIVDKLASGPPAPPGPAPRFAVYNIQLSEGRIDFEDRPARAKHAVTDLEIGLPFVSSMPAEIDILVQPRLSAKVNGTPFELAGETRPFMDRHVTTVRLDIDDLELAKYLAYSPVPLRIRVPSGKLSTRLVLSSTAVPGNPIETLVLSGTARLEGLRVQQADRAPLLAIAHLNVDLGGLELIRRHAVVTSLRIDAPEVDIARQKDGSLNLLAVAPAARPATPAKKSSGAPFTFLVEQIALTRGRVRFADQTPPEPVNLALNDVMLYVEGLGNAAGNSASVKLRAHIDRAPLEMAGNLALLPQGLELDLKASAQEIDLAPLSPYSIMYVGHGIEKGKLSLKHAYVVKDRKLTAENNVYLDQFTLGEKVESPTATTLPVAFAVSLLKDKNGVIDLNVPIAGALDDPQVSIGEVIRTAFRSPLEKAVSSPFAAIGGGEELAHLEFAPGSVAVDAAGEVKLKTLAKALYEHPGLKLEVSGRADSAQAVKTWLVESGKLAPERISIATPGMSAEGNNDKGKATRVDFALR